MDARMLPSLLDQAAWADACPHAAIHKLPATRPGRAYATRPYAHVAAAEHVWLAHVVLHGSYHRGQIALLTRAGGGTPAATDYILFIRSEHDEGGASFARNACN